MIPRLNGALSSKRAEGIMSSGRDFRQHREVSISPRGSSRSEYRELSARALGALRERWYKLQRPDEFILSEHKHFITQGLLFFLLSNNAVVSVPFLQLMQRLRAATAITFRQISCCVDLPSMQR